jgi:hypothetical protein
MENAVDALKMAGAALLFIIAFSISMMLFSKARESTDAVLDNLKIKDFFPKVESLNNNTTRKVGIETIIPTLYRYAQSDDNIRIRILNETGQELQVFDQEIESIVRLGSPSNEYETYISQQYNNPARPAYMFQAQVSQYRLERINAYINGTSARHMPNVNYASNNLKTHRDRLFEESYLEYRTSGQVYTDELGEEIVTIPASTKIVITYKITN